MAINSSFFRSFFEKVVGRVGGKTVENIEKATAETTSGLGNVFKGLDEATTFFRGEVFPGFVKAVKGPLTNLFKVGYNAKKWTLAKAISENVALRTMLPEDKVKIAKSIIFGLDSIKEHGINGANAVPFTEWKDLDFRQKIAKARELIPQLTMEDKMILHRWKTITDNLGELMETRKIIDVPYEEYFTEKLRSKLKPEEFQESMGLLGELSNATGEKWTTFNAYFPHSPEDIKKILSEALEKEIREGTITPEQLNKVTLEEIENYIAGFGKISDSDLTKIRAFWEKERRGSLFQIRESLYDALGFLEYSHDYIKMINQEYQRAFNHIDLLKLMARDHLDEFNSFLDYVKLKYPHLWGVNREIPLELITETKTETGEYMFPRLKEFVEDLKSKGVFTDFYTKKRGPALVLMDYHTTFPVQNKNIENLFQILVEELGETDLATELTLKNMSAGERRYFLITNDDYAIIQRIRNLRSEWREIDNSLKLWRNMTKGWKSFVTFITRYIPWRLANTIGDLQWNLFLQPTSLRKMVEAWSLSKEIARGRLPASLKPYEQELITAGTIFGDSDNIFQVEYLTQHGNIWKTLMGYMQEISQRLEMTPKLASFLDNLERVEKGQSPVLTGAEKWIKDLAKEELWKIHAIAEHGATLTIDYTAMPPKFRGYISQFIAPFAYWYVKSLSKISHLFVSKDGFIRASLMTIAPMSLFYWWNISDPKRKAIWEALPPWAKFFSVVAGIDDSNPNNPKPIVFNFYGPGQMYADFLGFDIAFDLAQKVKSGEYEPMEAATAWLFGAPTKVATKFMGLLNPLAQMLVMLGTNRDPFLNRQIIPENLEGTPEGRVALFNYAVQRVGFSAIVPAMMAGNLSDTVEMVKRVVGEKEFSLAREFLDEFTDRMFNPLRAITINPDSVRYYVSNAAFVEQQEMRKRTEDYLQRMYKALKSGNVERFKEMYEKAERGELDFVTAYDIHLYFNRPSTQAKWIKDVILPRIKDPEIRQKTRELINQLRGLEAIKHARKSQKNAITTTWLTSNDVLFNREVQEEE